ncbi:MAG: MgtC/SapB family protein [Paracoccaceae bacterium]
MDVILTELSANTTMPWQVILLRLLGAVMLTGLIGLERESMHSPAGLRTHMLVSLAAALFCLVTLEMVGRDYPDNVRSDPLRMVEAVTAGVAFLAAGMIVFSKGEVKGLTTGASLWLASAIGLCAGLGLWPMAVMTTVIALVIIRLLRLVSKPAAGENGERPEQQGR